MAGLKCQLLPDPQCCSGPAVFRVPRSPVGLGERPASRELRVRLAVGSGNCKLGPMQRSNSLSSAGSASTGATSNSAWSGEGGRGEAPSVPRFERPAAASLPSRACQWSHVCPRLPFFLLALATPFDALCWPNRRLHAFEGPSHSTPHPVQARAPMASGRRRMVQRLQMTPHRSCRGRCGPRFK